MLMSNAARQAIIKKNLLHFTIFIHSAENISVPYVLDNRNSSMTAILIGNQKSSYFRAYTILSK